MKLNVKHIDKFIEIIRSCTGPVWLTDWQVNEQGEYNLKLNLKSEISMYLGIAELLKAYGEWLEIHVSNREDEAKLIAFMQDEDKSED